LNSPSPVLAKCDEKLTKSQAEESKDLHLGILSKLRRMILLRSAEALLINL